MDVHSEMKALEHGVQDSALKQQRALCMQFPQEEVHLSTVLEIS